MAFVRRGGGLLVAASSPVLSLCRILRPSDCATLVATPLLPLLKHLPARLSALLSTR